MLDPLQAGSIQGRIGVVFAQEAEESRLLVELIGDVHRLDHGAHDLGRIILEGDDSFGAGAHADPAAAAPGEVRLGRALYVLIDGAEGAFFCTSLALGAPLKSEVREGHVAPTGMDRLSPGRDLYGLDGLESGAASIFPGVLGIQGGPNTTGRIDPCPSALVGEADEVGIGEVVLEEGQIRALPIGQVQDLGVLQVSQLLHRLLGVFQLDPLLILHHYGLGVHVLPDQLAIGGSGDHPCGQHDQVGLQLDVSAQEGVLGLHLEGPAAIPDAGDFGFGEEYPRVLLGFLVEGFVLTGASDVLVKDVSLGVGAHLTDHEGLFDGDPAAHAGAVGQVVLVSGSGALDKGDPPRSLPVAGTDDLPLGQHLLHLDVGDDVGAGSVSQMA